MRDYLVIEIATKRSIVTSLDEAARIAGIDAAELEWTIEQDGTCRTDRHTITESVDPQALSSVDRSDACFMVEDGDRHVGYFRKRENAERVAATLDDPHVGELFPPDPIACDDDETQH
jgi:hypothetical protein